MRVKFRPNTLLGSKRNQQKNQLLCCPVPAIPWAYRLPPYDLEDFQKQNDKKGPKSCLLSDSTASRISCEALGTKGQSDSGQGLVCNVLTASRSPAAKALPYRRSLTCTGRPQSSDPYTCRQKYCKNGHGILAEESAKIVRAKSGKDEGIVQIHGDGRSTTYSCLKVRNPVITTCW